tara:strand:- start:138 stop:614 length:477 start_codon:yes stop_codon:yes gene_type:complete
MVLYYFNKKENTEKNFALEIYKNILRESNFYLNQNEYFLKKDYNSSFELVSIFLILYIQHGIKNKTKETLKINENLISHFIGDLDESLRVNGIGDMSIGKYVKSYVKKFYYRLSIFPKNYDTNNIKFLSQYLTKFNLVTDNTSNDASRALIKHFKNLV